MMSELLNFPYPPFPRGEIFMGMWTEMSYLRDMMIPIMQQAIMTIIPPKLRLPWCSDVAIETIR